MNCTESCWKYSHKKNTYSEFFEITLFKFLRCFASAITWGAAHKRKKSQQNLTKIKNRFINRLRILKIFRTTIVQTEIKNTGSLIQWIIWIAWLVVGRMNIGVPMYFGISLIYMYLIKIILNKKHLGKPRYKKNGKKGHIVPF